jgi:hypothetical protein
MLLRALALVAALAVSAGASPWFSSPVVSTPTADTASDWISGYHFVAASSNSYRVPTISLDGPSGGVNASSFTAKYGGKFSTGTFTGTGNGVYDLTLSSGMIVNAGGITAPWFNGRVTPGNVDLSTTAKVGACAGVNFVQGNTNTGPTCAQPSDVTGNAATVTNGVYTTGSYFDPAWVKSLAPSKVDGSTYTIRINDLYNVKLSTGVQVPTALLDYSTITTALAGKQATGNYITGITGDVVATGPGSVSATIQPGAVTAAKLASLGISSSCASGFHLSTTTVSNGILTGGSCVADGAGGGGLSSITITSVTASGGSIISLYGPGISTPGFALDGAGLTLSSSGVIGVKNLTFVASTETYPSGTLAASSSAGPCFSASTATWTQGNNKALFCFSGSAIQSAGGFAALSFLIDGQFPDGLTATKGVPLQTSGATGSAVSFCWLTKNALSAGAHNACLTGLTNGNTLTIPNATTLNTLAQFSVQELATGGAGYSAPSSSFTVVAPGAYTNTTFAAAITTVTLTVNGGVMDIWGMGSWSSSSNGMALGVLVDGMYISTTSGQTAYGQSTVFGTVSEDKNMGAVNGVPAAFGYATNLSFPPIRVSGLSSGSHSVALTLKTDGTMTLPPANYPQVKYYFGASEVRNSAGTGDVSSNGTNTFSGSNTFTGPISGVSQSSWTALTWTSLPAAINSNTLFNVGIATIAFTAHQSGPIKCWVSAGIANGNSGTCDVGWSVLVDGVNIDGHPVTIPVMKAGATGSNVSVNQFATAYTSTNTYTAGLHNFVMTMASNNCNINATALAAPSANVGSPQFGCSTVP